VTDALLLLAVKVASLTVNNPSPSASPVSSRATSDDIVRPGWLGFLVFLLMAGAVALLLRSFVKHLKRIDFDESASERPRGDAGTPPPDVPAP
jgi:hypothetical protein